MKTKIRNRNKIRNRLILTFVILVSAIINIVGWFFYYIAKKSLDVELGKRLVAVAQSSVIQIRSEWILQLQPGDENSRIYKNIREKLDKIKEVTNVSRIYIFDREYKSLADTDTSVSIGDKYISPEFDRVELKTVFEKNTPAYSTLFEGKDGILYKSGYAPFVMTNSEDNRGDSGNITVAVLAVDASADFLSSVKQLRNSIITINILSILVTIITSIFFARRIVTNINKLVTSAENIGKGDFETKINVETSDEIGFLAQTMDAMRKNISEHNNYMKMMLIGIAHEIRNPLGGMEIFAGLLSDELDTNDNRREYVEKIKKELRNLKRIVNEFCDFAKPLKTFKEEVDLKSLVFEVYALIENEAKLRNIKFITNLQNEEAKLPTTKIYVDSEQFKQVLINLMRNAIQSMNNGGILSINFNKTKDYDVIKISDTGEGIPTENMEKLFEPFFTTREKGTGLGLAIAKKIIENHQGIISCKSELGKGSEFEILLPINQHLC